MYARLVELGSEWADAQAAAAMLEETAKPLFAKIALDHMGPGTSKAQAELEAYASPDYLDHVTRMVAAKQAANKARVRYASAMTWAELLRTHAATRRAEMAMGHMAP